MGITCADRRWLLARRMHSISLALFLPISVRSSVGAKVPSAGLHSLEILKTSTVQTRLSSTSSHRRLHSNVGSHLPDKKSTFRGYPLAFAGWAMGNATRPDWPSTNWLPEALSKLLLSLGAIT